MWKFKNIVWPDGRGEKRETRIMNGIRQTYMENLVNGMDQNVFKISHRAMDK